MTQQNRETLLALIERAEKSTAESFDLFAEAFEAIHGGRSSERLLWSQFCALIEAGAWLDAAMSLVPEGWDWCMVSGPGFSTSWCDGSGDPAERETVDAATPALALCAASLRAHATLDPTGEKA